MKFEGREDLGSLMLPFNFGVNPDTAVEKFLLQNGLRHRLDADWYDPTRQLVELITQNDRTKWVEKTLCQSAAKKSHLEVLKYLHENGCPWVQETLCRVAAERGSLEMLKYVHDNGCEWDWQTCTAAAKGGHLDILKYAHENGCEWDWKTCLEAAQEGHLKILECSLNNRINETTERESLLHGWDEGLLVHPSEFRQRLDKLKWERDKGDEWDWGTFLDEAKKGDSEVKKWATEHGCPWDSKLCLHVAEGGHLDVLQWLKVMSLQIGVKIPVRRTGQSKKQTPEEVKKEKRDWKILLNCVYEY